MRRKQIGVAGFEPTASSSQMKRSAKLSYTPAEGKIFPFF